MICIIWGRLIILDRRIRVISLFWCCLFVFLKFTTSFYWLKKKKSHRNDTVRRSLSEYFFLVRHKLSRGFPNLVWQQESTVANAFRTVQTPGFGDVPATRCRPRLGRHCRCRRSCPHHLEGSLCPYQLAQAAAAMWGALSLCAGPVIWGQAGRLCSSQYTQYFFSR